MFSCMKLYGLPGGNQVDGLPSAASEALRSLTAQPSSPEN